MFRLTGRPPPRALPRCRLAWTGASPPLQRQAPHRLTQRPLSLTSRPAHWRKNQAFEAKAQASNDDVSPELEDKMNRHKNKDTFRDEALAVRLPQFFIQVQNGGFFAEEPPFQLFEREELVKGIPPVAGGCHDLVRGCRIRGVRVDLEQLGDGDYAPRAFKLAARERVKFTDSCWLCRATARS